MNACTSILICIVPLVVKLVFGCTQLLLICGPVSQVHDWSIKLDNHLPAVDIVREGDVELGIAFASPAVIGEGDGIVTGGCIDQTGEEKSCQRDEYDIHVGGAAQELSMDLDVFGPFIPSST